MQKPDEGEREGKMSLIVKCACNVTGIHQEVLNRTLQELQEKFKHLTGYRKVAFKIQNGEIVATYDEDYHTRSGIRATIQNVLTKHKELFHKEELKRKKIAVAKVLKKLGFKDMAITKTRGKIRIKGTK